MTSTDGDNREEIGQRSHWPLSILSSLCALLNMAMPLLLVRILSPEEIGRFKIFFLYLLIAPALSLGSGLLNGISYWSGKREAQDRINDSSVSIIFLAVLFGSLLIIFRQSLTELLGWPGEYFLIFILASFAVIIGNFFEEACIASGKVWRGAIFHSVFELLRTGLVLFSALYFKDLFPVLFVLSLILLTKAIVGVFAGFFWLGIFRPRLSLNGLSRVWRYAFPVSGAAIFGLLVNNADQLILSHYLSVGDFAYYALGCLSVPPLLILEHSITRVLIPQLSQAFEMKDKTRAQELYRRAVEQLGFLLIPAVCGLIVFSKPIIELLFTERYASASIYLSIYALSYLMLIVPYDSLPRARGQGNWILANFASFSTITLLLCAVLTSKFGATGALVGLICGQTMMRTYGLIYIRRTTDWKWSEFLPLEDLRLFLTFSLLLSGLSLFMRPMFMNDLYWMLICGSAFLLFYFFCVFSAQRAGRVVKQKCSRVLMVTQHLQTGGLERMILQLCRELSKQRSWELWVYAYDQKSNQDSEQLKRSLEEVGVRVEVFAKPSGFSPRAVLRLVQIIIKNDIEVLHTHDMGSLIYGCLARVISLFRVKLVHTQHSFVHLQKESRYAFYERIFTRLVNELVVVSENGKSIYGSIGVPSSSIHFIPNGVSVPEKLASPGDLEEIRKRLIESTEQKIDQNSVWILYLARLHPVKGHQRAVQLWESLEPELREHAKLIFVGPESVAGQKGKLLERMQRSKAASTMIYAGASSNPEEWLRAADIFLSCSEHEGMPLAPLEALAQGKQLVLSDIPGHLFLSTVANLYHAEDIKHGASVLGGAINQALQRRNTSQVFHQAELARQFVQQEYSVRLMAEKYQYLYASNLSRNIEIPGEAIL